jgi:hypothetical protein
MLGSMSEENLLDSAMASLFRFAQWRAPLRQPYPKE